MATLAGWMYVIKGIGRNTALVKISSDGKRRIVVCTQFHRCVMLTDTNLYYIDKSNALRVVRTDGKDNTLIADNIHPESVVVDKKCIYYLRKEFVDENKYASSFYRMDLDGHNVKKLIFNVNMIDNYDEKSILIYREEKALFELYIPIDKKNTTKTERRYFDLKHYCRFDKNTGKLETLLVLGLPCENEYSFKRGCFGKSTMLHSTYKQIPEVKKYTRKNIAKPGAVYESEQEQELQKAAENNANQADNYKMPSGGCCGCSKKK